MSIYATKWAYAQAVRPSGRKFVLVSIANFADAEGRAYPGVNTLAEMTGQDERSVRRHIDALEEDGYLRTVSRRRADGSRTTDDLYLLAPAEALNPEPVQARKGGRKRAQADNLSGSEVHSGGDAQADNLPGGQADTVSGSQPDNLSGPTGHSVTPNRAICQGLPDTVSGHELSDEPSDEPSVTDNRQTAAAVEVSEPQGAASEVSPPGGAALAVLVGAFQPWNVRSLMAEYPTRSRWTDLTPERIRELHTQARDQHGRRYRGDLAELLDTEVRAQPSHQTTSAAQDTAEIDMAALIDGAPLDGNRRRT